MSPDGSEPTPSGATRPGVLIVDDDADVLEGIRGYLADALADAPVHVASTSAAGLALLDREPVGVIISDYRMPGGDGVSFLTRVRAAHPEARTVLWSAFPDRGLAERAFGEAGAACFVTKLAPPTTLLSLVKDLMASRVPRGNASHVVVNPAWHP